jgi:threonine aldolase
MIVFIALIKLEFMTIKSFASDNYSGIHTKVLEAIAYANQAQVPAYGEDKYTFQAIKSFKKIFGEHVEVFLVFNGTASNVLGLKTLTESFGAVICSDCAHIHLDECGAPENFIGSKLFTIPNTHGKISPEQVSQKIIRKGDQHHVQARVISITQSTEYGTVYTTDEILKLSSLARSNDMFLHMDGARFANAVDSLGIEPSEISQGVDVLSFGGTKNGLMCGEAVIFLNPALTKNFKYIRKQSMQLASKMRFISAQFTALLEDGLWLNNARQANQMAQYLAKSLQQIPWLSITQPVQVNAVFVKVPPELIKTIQEKYSCYVWNEENSELRWMTAFDTRPEDIDEFVSFLKVLKTHERRALS